MFHVLQGTGRRGAYTLLPLMIVRALLDTIGVATVLPFIAVVTDPNQVFDNRYLSWTYETLRFQSVEGFLIFLGFVSLAILFMSNGLAIAVEYFVKRFAMRQGHLLQRQLLYLSLSRPYASFLSLHSGQMGQGILSEVREYTHGVLHPFLLLVSRLLATLVLLGLLVAVDPVLALTTGAVLTGLYLLIYQAVRRLLTRIGEERQATDRIRFQAVAETYGGIKDVKVSGRELVFLDRFARAARRHASLEVLTHMARRVPKYLLEAVAFGGIIGIVLYLLAAGRPTSAVLSIVTLYAFACYRLIPSVQQIYEATSQLRYSLPALELLEKHLDEAEASPITAAAPRGVNVSIQLREVAFVYPGAERASVNGVSISIPQAASTALVGTTGSGKTTILDLLLGLLSPTTGSIMIDNEPLVGERVRQWQAAIGYVPQQVFLSDDTVARNIAFGVPEAEIDLDAVERAARMAQIHEVIESLPHGYSTLVGERGIRLSGGQQQRLGIARALYHGPEVIVLDEATSALDSVTERAILDSLRYATRDKTLIVVTHRLTTVRDFDQIAVLEAGRILEQGTYDELMVTSEAFRAMAQRTDRPEEAAISNRALPQLPRNDTNALP